MQSRYADILNAVSNLEITLQPPQKQVATAVRRVFETRFTIMLNQMEAELLEIAAPPGLNEVLKTLGVGFEDNGT